MKKINLALYCIENSEFLTESEKKTYSFLYENLLKYDLHNNYKEYFEPAKHIIDTIKKDIASCNNDVELFKSKFNGTVKYSGWCLSEPSYEFYYQSKFVKANEINAHQIPIYFRYYEIKNGDYANYMKTDPFIPECELVKLLKNTKKYKINGNHILIYVNTYMFDRLEDGLITPFLCGCIAHELDHCFVDKYNDPPGLIAPPYGLSKWFDDISNKNLFGLSEDENRCCHLISYILSLEEKRAFINHLKTMFDDILNERNEKIRDRYVRNLLYVFQKNIDDQLKNSEPQKDYPKAIMNVLMRLKVSREAHKLHFLYDALEHLLNKFENYKKMRVILVLGYVMNKIGLLKYDADLLKGMNITRNDVIEYFEPKTFRKNLKEPTDNIILDFVLNNIIKRFVDYVNEVKTVIQDYAPLFLDFIGIEPMNKEDYKFVYDFPKNREQLSIIENCINAEERRIKNLKELYETNYIEQPYILRDINVLNESIEKAGRTPDYIL